MGIGTPFEKGNKKGRGRPPGSRNRRTIFLEALEKGGEEIIEKIKLRALNSDPTAMRLCMERLLPVSKTANARFRFPGLDTAASLSEAVSAVAQAVAEGRISAQEGESLARIIESQRKNFEAGEFEARIRVLEEAAKNRGAEER
jgi:hypothetical protein